MGQIHANFILENFNMTEYTKQSNLYQIINHLSRKYGDQIAIDITRKLCLETSSHEVMKIGLEFLYINGFNKDLQQLIYKNYDSAIARNREWAYVYQLNINRRYNNQSPAKQLDELNRFQTNDPDLQCVIELTKVTLYHNTKNFSELGNFIFEQPELFNKVSDPFLLECFYLRLYQQLFFYYWKRNELITARKYAFRAINQTKNEITTAHLHLNLGLSYTFDTYQQAMYHTKEALKIYKKNKIKKYVDRIEQNNIPFLSAQFGIVEGITTNEKSEQAHLEIAKGNYERALTILETLTLDSPFHLYYYGLANQDRNILLQSYNAFVEKRRDYFFSRLPANALKKYT